MLLGTPAALLDQEPVDRRVVERPEKVGGAGDVEAAPQCPALVERLDDRPLVRMKLGLDPLPEGGDLASEVGRPSGWLRPSEMVPSSFARCTRR
jgi:hypothetical protein